MRCPEGTFFGSLLTFDVMPLGQCSVQVFRDGQLLKAFARVLFAGRHECYHAIPCTWVEYGLWATAKTEPVPSSMSALVKDDPLGFLQDYTLEEIRLRGLQCRVPGDAVAY